MNPVLAGIKPLCNDRLFNALAHLPPSLELVEIGYACAKTNDVQARRSVFGREIKQQFLQHIGEFHASELAAMGLDTATISAMRDHGKMPKNSHGQQLDASVDHILSLHFGGTNDFENLALLPRRLNALKDMLETLQLEKAQPAGTLVTITPKRINGHYPKVPFVAGGFKVAKLHS